MAFIILPGLNKIVKHNWIISKDALVLITGANGFIGSKVYEILLEYGFKKIRCLVRSSKNLTEMKRVADSAHAEVEFIEGNLLSTEDCRRAARDVSVIFHLAAGRGKTFAGCFMDSAVATRNLLDAALEVTSLKRFLNVSSIAVYSGYDIRRGDILDETSPIESEHMARFDPYAYGKIKQDEIVQAYGKEHGLPFVIVRPGLVYGPGKKAIPGRVGIDTFGWPPRTKPAPRLRLQVAGGSRCRRDRRLCGCAGEGARRRSSARVRAVGMCALCPVGVGAAAAAAGR